MRLISFIIGLTISCSIFSQEIICNSKTKANPGVYKNFLEFKYNMPGDSIKGYKVVETNNLYKLYPDPDFKAFGFYDGKEFYFNLSNRDEWKNEFHKADYVKSLVQIPAYGMFGTKITVRGKKGEKVTLVDRDPDVEINSVGVNGNYAYAGTYNEYNDESYSFLDINTGAIYENSENVLLHYLKEEPYLLENYNKEKFDILLEYYENINEPQNSSDLYGHIIHLIEDSFWEYADIFSDSVKNNHDYEKVLFTNDIQPLFYDEKNESISDYLHRIEEFGEAPVFEKLRVDTSYFSFSEKVKKIQIKNNSYFYGDINNTKTIGSSFVFDKAGELIDIVNRDGNGNKLKK